jgi:hypothetical protein
MPKWKKKSRKRVSDIIRDQELTDTNKEIEFEMDENELKRYLDVVIKEVKMKGTNGSV